MITRLSWGWKGIGAALAGLVLALPVLVIVAGSSGEVLARSPGNDSAATPSYESVRAAHQPSGVVLLDRHGEAIADVRQDFDERRGRWVPLPEISPAMQRAVLLSEDHRFYEHDGVDWLAVARAGWEWVVGDGRRGASTISMQVAAMLAPELRRPHGGRTLVHKFRQVRHARRLEEHWTKQQILEAYLNLAAFRGELRGIDAVSRVMFAKHPHGLGEDEAAVAAALLRGPNAGEDLVWSRACALLQTAQSGNACELSRAMVKRWLAATGAPAADRPALAPHFARMVLTTLPAGSGLSDVEPSKAGLNGEWQIPTTLDAPLQRHVMQSIRRHLSGMGLTRLTDAAVVVLDNGTGDVLAYVGSSGELSAAGEVDHARAPRQAGSTLKPFLYALALESRYLTAASLLKDAPLDVATAGGLYIPRNYDGQHAGWVSVRTALAASLNIPAVRTLMLIGPERFADRLRALGLPLLHEAEHYGYSLSLGSADVDLFSLTNAYRALAKNGRWSTARMRRTDMTSGQAPVQVFDPMATWIVGDILSDRRARARTFGLESALSTRFWTAVKTGTSKDMRDNWTVGFSEQYTVGVWVGNSHGESMRDVSGVSGAAPIWHDVMSYLHAETPSRQPQVPSLLQYSRVEFSHGLEPARLEYFIPGTSLSRVEPVLEQEDVGVRILSPAAGTVFALDPDMPAEVQRLVMRASMPPAALHPLQWYVGSRLVAQGPEAKWAPLAGNHTVELRDANGRILDQLRIEVRGLPRARSPLNDGPGPEFAGQSSVPEGR